ncbi:MAG: hypothetical protein JWM21_2458 [Acidobacteria bacterium]|nr:hypothetical protein [Acidobacteriota bacterium]
MQITLNYFLSATLRTVAAVALIAGTTGILTSSALGQAQNRSWSAAGSTGTVDDDSTAIAQFKNFAVTLQPGINGTARVRYNITAVDGMNSFCPATASTVKVRFRNSDNNGNTAKVSFDIKVTNVLTGGSTVLYHFDSNAKGAGTAFTTFTDAAVPVDFDFAQNVYWIDATIFRSVASEFSDLGSIQIWESAGTACP